MRLQLGEWLPLLPPPPSHARGGAPRTVPDRACMAAIIFMARTSTPWALLPVGEFGCGSVSTCWRRFAEWAAAGVFEQLQQLLRPQTAEHLRSLLAGYHLFPEHPLFGALPVALGIRPPP
jgi:transposase